jgi:hypothetical protein
MKRSAGSRRKLAPHALLPPACAYLAITQLVRFERARMWCSIDPMREYLETLGIRRVLDDYGRVYGMRSCWQAEQTSATV